MSLLFSVSFSTQALVILQYHHIDDSTPAVTSTRVDDFMAHMELLEKEGMHIIDLKDALEKVQRNEALPEKSVAITFDDAYSSIYDNAWPKVKELGWPFNNFVKPTQIDNKVRNKIKSEEHTSEPQSRPQLV